MEVHNVLGCGFLEGVYQEALEIELAERNIPFFPQYELPVQYKERVLRKHYLVDLVVFEKILVEIKALERLTTREEAQIINYLKASPMEVGLVINFGTEKLEWKRKILTNNR